MPQEPMIADVLRRDLGMLKMTLADMTDEDLAQRPVPTANNALWQLGHLISAEASIVNSCAGKTVITLPAGFADKYKKETAGANDPAKLGKKADLIALFEKVRQDTANWVATLSPADMAGPAPEMMRSFFPTVGHVIHLLPGHVAMHHGQIQVLRRKLGKPILF